MPSKARCVCTRTQKAAMAKGAVKKTIRSVLTGAHSSGPKANSSSSTTTTSPRTVTQCRACKVASNRQGVLLSSHRLARLEQRDAYGDESRAEIRGFIWGSGSSSRSGSGSGSGSGSASGSGGSASGSDDDDELAGDGDDGDDENEVLVNRIYSMLLLENSSVIDFLESHSGRGLDEMPKDMRKDLERVIAAQVQMF
jgi:hypothetical protein